MDLSDPHATNIPGSSDASWTGPTGPKCRTLRIKIAGRNINHLRYGDDTALMAESEEELKSLLKKFP